MLRSVGKQSVEFVESAPTPEEEKEGCRGKDLEKRKGNNNINASHFCGFVIILSNSTRKLLWFKITKMLIAVKKEICCAIYYNFRHNFVPC